MLHQKDLAPDLRKTSFPAKITVTITLSDDEGSLKQTLMFGLRTGNDLSFEPLKAGVHRRSSAPEGLATITARVPGTSVTERVEVQTGAPRQLASRPGPDRRDVDSTRVSSR